VTTQDERIATLEADARIKAANLELAQARVAELEAALAAMIQALEFHRAQTRPIHLTDEVLKVARAAMKDHHD
jgi:RNase H-fold protein (predicted Holliday junction resolvase)